MKKSLKKGLTNENICCIIVKHNCEGQTFVVCDLLIEN